MQKEHTRPGRVRSAAALARSRAGWLPYAALLVGIVSLGLSAMFVRWAGAPGPVSGFYRMAIAALVLGLPAARGMRQEAAGRPGRLSRRHVALAALGGLLFAGDLACWNTAVLLTNAANATLLANTSPVWVGLGALVLFRERLGWAFWAGLALALTGAAVILGQDILAQPELGLGELLGLTAGVFYGSFFLATERARDRLSPLTAWWISALSSTAALLALSLLFRQPLTGYSALSYLNLLAVALVTQVGGYLSISYALGHLPASIVSPTLLGQPVLTALLAIPLLGEPLGRDQVIGGALVLAGIWLVNRPRQKAGESGPRPNTRASAGPGD
jgi:drug/metabolite transporter (DMT)-like permease